MYVDVTTRGEAQRQTSVCICTAGKTTTFCKYCASVAVANEDQCVFVVNHVAFTTSTPTSLWETTRLHPVIAENRATEAILIAVVLSTSCARFSRSTNSNYEDLYAVDRQRALQHAPQSQYEKYIDQDETNWNITSRV